MVFGAADQLCECLIRKTSAYLSSIFPILPPPAAATSEKKDISHGSDSAIFCDEPKISWSRSSSQCSVCSCLSCSLKGEWKRRPSRLLEGYDVEDFYRFDAVLGEGSFSTVYLGESKAQKGGWVAIKVVAKANLLKTKKIHSPMDSNEQHDEDDDDIISRSMVEHNEEEMMRLVDKEISIMTALDHPHVIHLEEVYEDENRVCFVMELAQGGEVFDRLVEKVTFDEIQAVDLIVQLLCAMSYIHSQGIVHRDLKLENLLYYDDAEDSRIMVADFGLSDWVSVLEDGSSPICGTPGYMAPEVISRQSCTPKADVWAIGVITYILLAGYPPFYVQDSEEQGGNGGSSDADDAVLLRKIVQGDYEFHEATWKDISPEAIHFIRTLMCQDPNERPNCDEALTHPWLNDRHNLEKRAAERKRKNSSPFLEHSSWTVVQQIAFVISVLVILGSYSALITYLFNIAKPGVYVHGFIANIRSEFDQIYGSVCTSIDNCLDAARRLIWHYLTLICNFSLCIHHE